MKVLHIVGFHPDIGGAYTVIKNLTKWLDKLGCKVGICSVLPENYLYKDIEVPQYMEDALIFKSNKMFSKFWPSFTNQIKEITFIVKKYDIIHISGLFDYYSYFVSKNLNIPYIISPHGTLQPEVIHAKRRFEKRIFLLLIGKRILERAGAIHVLTEYERQSLIDYLGIKNSIFLIPNGIDPEDFENLPQEGALFEKYPNLKGKKIVLFLSRINWKKGLDDLIPAFREVVREINNAHLLLVGPDNDGYMKYVNEWIEQYDLHKYTTYFGPAYGEDKLMVLQDSNIFVLPSYSEGFPVSVVEAMYMQLPVVVTDRIGIPEIVSNYNAGIVIKKDKNEIVNAIITLLKNEKLAKSMGDNGRNCIFQNFLWENIAKQMLEVYKKILSNKN
ncbi:MAG: glycosyltransferase [candidate division WOR-3 bacterium]